MCFVMGVLNWIDLSMCSSLSYRVWRCWKMPQKRDCLAVLGWKVEIWQHQVVTHLHSKNLTGFHTPRGFMLVIFAKLCLRINFCKVEGPHRLSNLFREINPRAYNKLLFICWKLNKYTHNENHGIVGVIDHCIHGSIIVTSCELCTAYQQRQTAMFAF